MSPEAEMIFRTHKTRTAHRGASLLAVSLLGAAALSIAQSTEPPPPANHWFDWSQNDYYQAGILRKCSVTPGVYAEFNQTAHKIAQAWGETPGSTGPDEYAQWMWQPYGCHLGSLKGHLQYWPWPRSDFRMEAVPGHPGKARPHITGEALYMMLDVNQPAGLTPENNMNPKDSQEVGYIHVSRRIGGYPVYNFDHVLVVEAKGRSIFEPVSLGEALERWIQYAYPGEAAIERHKALLAQLSPDELKQPAYLQHDGNSDKLIVTAPNDKTDPIVRYSRSYFDKNVSPATAQLLTLDLHFLDLVHDANDPVNAGHRYSLNILNAADWGRMAALLH
jgi:hypothetical protein